jgi:hypothetical protein
MDEQHIALPKLYGAPAYGRPPSSVSIAHRPFDPDELPIEAFRSEEEQAFVATLPARAYAPGGATLTVHDTADRSSIDGRGRRPAPLKLRAIAGKILGGN